MAEYSKKSLRDNEQIILKAKLNSIIRIPYIVATFLLFYLAFKTDGTAFLEVRGFFIILGIIFLVNAFKVCILLDTTELCFTNKRVIGKVGWINTKTLDSPIIKINDVLIIQSFVGKIFNYSTIKICTSSSSYYFKYVENAEEFKNELTTFIDNLNSTKIDKSEKEVNNYDKLIKLKELLDKNIITEEEFNEEKSKILK